MTAAPKQTFAIGCGNVVSLWCEGSEERFYVINGEWDGWLKDGVVGYGKTSVGPGEVLWRGHAPFTNSNYNEAITWIEKQLN